LPTSRPRREVVTGIGSTPRSVTSTPARPLRCQPVHHRGALAAAFRARHALTADHVGVRHPYAACGPLPFAALAGDRRCREWQTALAVMQMRLPTKHSLQSFIESGNIGLLDMNVTIFVYTLTRVSTVANDISYSICSIIEVGVIIALRVPSGHHNRASSRPFGIRRLCSER
jgi:hypothetical protein